MEFLVFSRQMTEDKRWVDANCDAPHIWISIHDPEMPPAKIADHPKRLASIHLSFHDIEQASDWFGSKKHRRELIGMTDEHAQRVLDFVDEWKDKAELICVNCEAGICRSSGTAVALSLLLNGHDSGIHADERYLPNSWVKSKILREARIRAGQEIE